MVISRATSSLAAVLWLLVSWDALANKQRLSEEERPWSVGVSDERKKAAFKLFDEGNTLMEEFNFVQAAGKFREALTWWDHPLIHYNLALVLKEIDQPIEAYQHLVAAIRFGEGPLDAEQLENAHAHKDRLEKKFALVKVSCVLSGVRVTMDGGFLFDAPGSYEGIVRPGQHSFMVSKEGQVLTNLTRTMLEGQSERVDLRRHIPEDLRRWPEWRPWVIMGAGATVALSGGFFYLQARESYLDFDTRIKACGGCMDTPELVDARGRGDNLQRVAFTMCAVGGAALVTGAVLFYINRPQAHLTSPEDVGNTPEVIVAPFLGNGETGIHTTFRF
jgi:hypothetical protein